MNRFSKIHGESIAFATAITVLAASVAWGAWSRGEIKHLRAAPVALHFAKSDYVPATWPASETKPAVWQNPVPQSSGVGWVYELFTPPTVYFNPKTGQFAVIPPSEAVKTPGKFDITLIDVHRELFRVQLAGYFGEPSSYTAVFNQTGLPGTVFAKEGMALPGLELFLLKFFVTRVSPAAHDHDVPALIAIAELRDERSGEIVTLGIGEPKFAGEPVATIRAGTENTPLRNVRTGDVLTDEKSIYRVTRINYEPAELTIAHENSTGSLLETKVLHPAATELTVAALPSSDSPQFPHRPATGFSILEK